MDILAVEEDWWDRKQLKSLLRKAMPDANICAFNNFAEALEFAKENAIGAAFIDMGKSIHTPGYFLAKNILGLQRTNIIFTNYEWEHMREALELRVSGYIRKPLRYEDVLKELENLRYPLIRGGLDCTDTTIDEASPYPSARRETRRSLFRKIRSLFFRRKELDVDTLSKTEDKNHL